MRNNIKKILIIIAMAIFLYSCDTEFKYGPGYRTSNFDNTPIEKLAKAVKENDYEKIHKIVKNDKNIDVDYIHKKYGNTLLMVAVNQRKIKSIKALLECGANPNKLADFDLGLYSYDSPIFELIDFFRYDDLDYEILDLLFEYGADPNACYYKQYSNKEYICFQSVLGEATMAPKGISNKNKIKLIKYLVDKGADVNHNSDVYTNLSPVANSLTSQNFCVTKYLIINCKAIISPNYSAYYNNNTIDLIQKLKIEEKTLRLVNEEDNNCRFELYDYIINLDSLSPQWGNPSCYHVYRKYRGG